MQEIKNRAQSKTPRHPTSQLIKFLEKETTCRKTGYYDDPEI
jgi:hypothetical protein